MKVRELNRRIEALGGVMTRQRGSHRRYEVVSAEGVRAFTVVPASSYPNPPQLKQAGMRFQMMNNAHPPGWALFVLWVSRAHRQQWAT